MVYAWEMQVEHVIDIIVQITGAMLAIGCALNGAYIVVYSGVEGGSRVIPEVILRVVGFIAGLYLAIYSLTFTYTLARFFTTPIF